MDDSDPNAAPDRLHPRRVLRKRLLMTGGIFTLGVAAWLLWGTTPALPQGLLVAKRGADGEFNVEGSVPSAGISGQLSSLKLEKTARSSSATSTGGSAAVMGRTLSLFNLSENPLAQRIGYELFQKLQETQRFDEIRYYPHDEQPVEGELLPELFATIDIPKLEETGVMPSRTLEAQVKTTLSDQYRRSSHGYRGTLSPPIVEFRWEQTINCKARNLGIETGSARYASVSENLAEDIVSSMTKQLDDLSGKHGWFAGRPAEFFPTYSPTPDFSFLTELEAKRLISGRNFMRSNVTVWQIDPAGELGDTMLAIAQGLKSAGWESSELDKAAEKTAFRVMRSNTGESFECFESQDGRFPKSPPFRVFVVYTKTMNSADTTAGLKELASRNVPERELVPFSSFWHLAKDAIADYFTRNPPHLVPSLVHLARQEVKAGNFEAARHLILRAAAMQQILKFGPPDDDLKKLAKEAGIADLPKLPDLAVLVPGTVTDLRVPTPLKVRFDGSEPLIFLLGENGESQRYLRVTRQRTPGGRESVHFVVNNIVLEPNGYSMSAAGPEYHIGQRQLLDQLQDASGAVYLQIFVTLTAIEDDVVTAEIVPRPFP